jgi:sec-independent protein translocase protein TatC
MKINYALFLGILFFICLGIGFHFSFHLINIINSLMPKGINLVSLNPSDGFLVIFWASITICFLLFSLFGGILLWFLSKDILFEHERKIIRNNILPVFVLFGFGFLFGLYMYLVLLIPYFIGINSLLGLQNIWSLNVILTSALMIGFSIGLSFQLPIIIRNAIKFGLIKKELLKKNRPIILLIILIVSAVITPPDMVSQLLVGLPLYLLFEMSLIGVKIKC